MQTALHSRILANAHKSSWQQAAAENPAPTWSIDDRQGSDRGKFPGYYIDRVIGRLEKNPVKMARVQVKQANLLFEDGNLVGSRTELDFSFEDDESR